MTKHQIPSLSEDQIRSLNNEVALALHSWVRDTAYGRPTTRARVLSAIESWIDAASHSDQAAVTHLQSSFHLQAERLLKQAH